jgi:hypothetical protein
MKQVAAVFLVMAALTLAACSFTTLAIDKNAAPDRVAADAGLPPGSITMLQKCGAARAIPGEKSAVYQPCLYAPTPDGAALLAFDENPGVYRVIYKLEPKTVNAVALKKMGRARQVQVHSRAGFFVFEFVSDDRVWGKPALGTAAFDHLRSLGITETEPVQYVYDYHPIRVQVTH